MWLILEKVTGFIANLYRCQNKKITERLAIIFAFQLKVKDKIACIDKVSKKLRYGYIMLHP